MSTYDAFVPKYDYDIGVPAPKPVAALRKEHQRRNDLKGEARGAGFKGESTDLPQNQAGEGGSSVRQQFVNEQTILKVVYEWEEMIANCSSPLIFKGPILHKKPITRPYEEIMPILYGDAGLDAIEKEKECFKTKLSTTIPLGLDVPCPGLVPKNVEELHLVKEDVVLKEPVIK